LTKTRRRIGDIERGGSWARIRLRCWQVLNPPNVAVSWAFQIAIGQLCGLPAAERNARLSALLRDAVAECRQTVVVHPVGHAGARAG
jgi:hypothetical protein